MEQVQGHKDDSMSRKAEHRTCYTCREMGHLGKDCPKDNMPKTNLVNYVFAQLRKDRAGTYAIIVIGPPQTSIGAIWIPKHLVANLDGPNKVWVPKSSC